MTKLMIFIGGCVLVSLVILGCVKVYEHLTENKNSNIPTRKFGRGE